MPTGNPPAYDQAVGQTATHPGADLGRSRTNDTVSTIDSADLDPGLVDDEGRKSMDDERRDLPPGWVRCFDPNTEHHFYVEEATKRSIWIHPYDDPQYLASLPKDHPAHPESKQGQAVRKASQDEEQMAKRQAEMMREQRVKSGNDKGVVSSSNQHEERNWFQKKKDKLIGTKEERQKARDEKRRQKEEERKRIQAAQEAYLKRRRELIQKQLNDPDIRRMYASDPYRYSPPSMAFSRAGALGSPYGYGYGGTYGRRYGYGYPGGYGYGGMGMGVPLFGGLAGGMLLGSAMSGGFGGGGFDGGCGGGDMGGGGGGF